MGSNAGSAGAFPGRKAAHQNYGRRLLVDVATACAV